MAVGNHVSFNQQVNIVNITRVVVHKLKEQDVTKKQRLVAVCHVTFDDAMVVKEIKIIDGTKGLFVAMPSRRITDHCPICHASNPMTARWCNWCGADMGEPSEPMKDARGNDKIFSDIVHMVTVEARATITSEILKAYRKIEEEQKPSGGT